MDFHAHDAVLVIQPGRVARGKLQIRMAFFAITQHFLNALTVKLGAPKVLEGADTVLFLMETLSFVGGTADPIKRLATCVFRRDQTGDWVCTVDHSYGTDLINAP